MQVPTLSVSGDIMKLTHQILYLSVREAHGCIKQRSILLIAQGAGKATRISFLATTHKHVPLMRPQECELLRQQTATDHWRASAVAVFARLVTPAM